MRYQILRQTGYLVEEKTNNFGIAIERNVYSKDILWCYIYECSVKNPVKD